MIDYQKISKRKRHKFILGFIRTIRDSSPISVRTYTRGGCYHFHKILQSLYPEAIAYCEGGDPIIEHVVTEISGKYYDIRGEYADASKLRKMTEENHKRAEKFEYNPRQDLREELP